MSSVIVEKDTGTLQLCMRCQAIGWCPWETKMKRKNWTNRHIWYGYCFVCAGHSHEICPTRFLSLESCDRALQTEYATSKTLQIRVRIYHLFRFRGWSVDFELFGSSYADHIALCVAVWLCFCRDSIILLCRPGTRRTNHNFVHFNFFEPSAYSGHELRTVCSLMRALAPPLLNRVLQIASNFVEY